MKRSILLIFSFLYASTLFSQPGCNPWRSSIIVRVDCSDNLVFYGHDGIYRYDSLEQKLIFKMRDGENDPKLIPDEKDLYHRASCNYILGFLKLGDYSNIRYIKDTIETNILVKCNYNTRRNNAATNIYNIYKEPYGGHYFIDLDSLRAINLLPMVGDDGACDYTVKIN